MFPKISQESILRIIAINKKTIDNHTIITNKQFYMEGLGICNKSSYYRVQTNILNVNEKLAVGSVLKVEITYIFMNVNM